MKRKCIVITIFYFNESITRNKRISDEMKDYNILLYFVTRTMRGRQNDYYDEFRKVIKNSYTCVVGLRDITEQNGCKMTNAYDMGYIITIKYKYCEGRG